MKPFRYFYSLPLFLSLAVVCSCSNDLLSDSETDSQGRETKKIGFVVSSNNVEATRSADNSSAEGLVLRADNNNDSLLVSTKIERMADDAPYTRGTAIEDPTAVNSITATCYIKDATNGNRVYFQNQPYTRNAETGLFAHQNGLEYWWLSRDAYYEFYNTTPVGATGLTFNGDGYSTFQYVVPTNATNQQDVMTSFATTESTAEVEPTTDYGFPVNVKFKHSLTQISVVQGEGMSIGTINSISFTGVSGTGTFDIKTNSWTEISTPNTFTYTANQATENGVSVTGENGNFFMIPQDLNGAEMHVSFTNVSNQTKVFHAALTGTWEQGKKYTYKITISPELSIGIAELQDAHYTMVEVPYEVVGCGTSGSYTLSVSCDDGGTWAKMRNNLVGPETSGYWIENITDYSEFNRSTTISGTGDGQKSVWVFLEENATEAERTATFTLSAGSTSTSVTITQLPPSWTGAGGTGWERLESTDTYPFGFDWTRKVTYSGSGLIPGILYYLMNWFGDTSTLVRFYTEGSILNRTYYIEIDYSKANELGDATDNTNGKDNTWALYSKAGFSLDAYESTLDGYSSFNKTVEGSTKKTDNYAALIALKCNPFTVTKETNSTETVYNVSITEDKIKWFLAAPDQFVCADTDYPMNGEYWSSNASATQIDEERCAYFVSMSNNSKASTTDASREGFHKVRALRIAR